MINLRDYIDGKPSALLSVAVHSTPERPQSYEAWRKEYDSLVSVKKVDRTADKRRMR